jgi:hypothetical protein
MNQRKKKEQPQMDTDAHGSEIRFVILNEVKNPERYTPANVLLDSSLRSE